MLHFLIALSLLVLNGCKQPEPKQRECKYPTTEHINDIPEQDIYFEQIDSNKTHRAGSLTTPNAQKLYRQASAYKYGYFFYKNQVTELSNTFERLKNVKTPEQNK